MEKLSFVIPCYRSEKTVGKVIAEIKETVEKDGRFDYEIVCVNDGSPDDTIGALMALSDDPHLKIIDLMRNFGQHSALMAGYTFVSGDYIVSLDDDGQNPPSEMFRLIDTMIEGGYDWVSAKYPEKKESLFRRMGSKLAFFMSEQLTGKPKEVDINSYCVIRRAIVEEIVKYENAYPFVHGLMLRATRNIANVEINHLDREVGSSGYSLGKLIQLFMSGFTAFSEKPLRIASFFGILFMIIGFVERIFLAIYNAAAEVPISDAHIVVSAVLFTGGLIMLLMGLLGEYIGRMYISMNKAPQFVVRSTRNMEEANYQKLKDKESNYVDELKAREIR